ncbi:MAG: acetate--CoA ligase family protein [Candidatus Syntropharchaeia archaeon]
MDLKRIFKPRRTAVIGVSLTNPFHPANVIYDKNLHTTETEVYPVNIKGGEIYGKKVYRRIGEIPEDIDLSVIVVRADFVPEIVEECGENGVGGAVIVSGGFSEAGEEELQREIISLSKKYDLAIMGPNCLGIYSPPLIDTFFTPLERIARPKKGNIAMISQSGGFLLDQGLERFYERDMGISAAVSIGNKAVIDEIALLRYFNEDPDTSVIVFYLEGFERGKGKKFLELARNSSKQVIIYKSGRSKRGISAVSSHTAALAGNYRVLSEAFRQFGVIEARDTSELISFSKALSFGLPPLKDGKIVILTVSGGHGVVATDLCEMYGLNLVEIGDGEKEELKKIVNPAIRDIASFENPIDFTGSVRETDMGRVLDYFLKRDDVDGVLILILPYAPMITTFVGSRLAKVAQRYQKPVIAYVPRLEKYRMIIEGFEVNGVPVAHTIEECVQMCRVLLR